MLISTSAKGDTSVVREQPFNSVSKLSDTEETRARLSKRLKKETSIDSSVSDEGSTPYLKEALSLMTARVKAETEIHREQLELAKARERREEQERSEREHAKRRELRIQERAQALDMLKHPDPEVSEEGRRILRRLREEESSTI